jgi:hypothetical protein
MIVKNLSKDTSKGKTPVEYTITLNKKQISELKALFKKRDQLMKECSKPAYFNDYITAEIIVDDEVFDMAAFFSNPKQDDEFPMIIGQMGIKKKKEADPMSRFITETWNSLRDPYDIGCVFLELRDTELPIMKELRRREDLIRALNNDFRAFFISLEQSLEAKGLAKSIDQMFLHEFEHLVDGLLNGDEMLLS